ncbi:hypothetical protein [Chloroflexus sp.]|uniref:hypothetical protein n=1 Tax=Chloroflexus sp. TaxID=1904827 RepID=UPI00298ED5E7|nr:hypothetical protein [Chloroflexus sp.]MDW8404236.1 hypothetical protein [Chloroflexus sp.]
MQWQLTEQIRLLSAQRWRQHAIETLVRAVSTGFIVACVGAMLPLFGLLEAPRPLLGWIIAGSAILGSLQALAFRLTPQTAARRLDRRFRLQEQLSTALELSCDQAGVAARLQQQAQESLARIQNYVNRTKQPLWPEALMLSALPLVLAGLLAIAPQPIPPVGVAEPLPELNRPDPVAEAPSPEPQPVAEAATGATGTDPGVLSALADALRDQSITRPVAEALDRGDIAGAADALRELADQMGEISPAAREALADALREVARAIDQARPDLADQMRATADALQFGDAVAGATGVEALADALERQPSAPVAAGAGGGAGNSPSSQRREQAFSPLGREGTPLELESNGTGQVPAAGTSAGQAGSNQPGRLPIRSSGISAGGPVQTADDPLRIPTDVRDVVRNYFSP